MAVLKGHTNWVYSVGLSGDGCHVVSGSEDGTVRVWEKGRDDGWETVRTFDSCGGSDDDVLEDGVGDTPEVDKKVFCSEEAKMDVLHALSAVETYRTRSGYAVLINWRPFLVIVHCED